MRKSKKLAKIGLKLEEFDTNESQDAEDEGIMGGGTGGYSKMKGGVAKKETAKVGAKRGPAAGGPKYKL